MASPSGGVKDRFAANINYKIHHKNLQMQRNQLVLVSSKRMRKATGNHLSIFQRRSWCRPLCKHNTKPLENTKPSLCPLLQNF